MKKLLAVLTCCLLAGCSSSPSPAPGVAAPGAYPGVEPPARQSMVFLVDSAADQRHTDAAELFAATVSSLTDGMFTVAVRSTVNAVADYRRGEGDLVLLDARQDSGVFDDLAFLSAPMRYTDYYQFTMALNSRHMLGFLEDGLQEGEENTHLLAAFSLASDYFITAHPLSRGAVDLAALQEDNEEELPDSEYDDDDEYRGRLAAALRTGSAMAPFMEQMGLEPIVEPDLNERLYNVVAGSAAIAEITLEELFRADWQDSNLNLISVGHTMAPVWLAVHADRWNSLPDKYRAVMQEAATYLFPEIDGNLRTLQEEQIAAMREGGVTFDSSFSALQGAAEAVYARGGQPSFREKYLLEILNGMQ